MVLAFFCACLIFASCSIDTVLILQAYVRYAAAILFPYFPDTLPILSAYSPHTVPILFPYGNDTETIRK